MTAKKPAKPDKRSGRPGELLAFINEYIVEHGYSPTYAEMCEGIGLRSKGSIYNLLQKLRDGGDVLLRPGSARTIRLTADK